MSQDEEIRALAREMAVGVIEGGGSMFYSRMARRLLALLDEAEAPKPPAGTVRDARLPCGHPAACDPARDDPNPGATHYCGWCAVEAERDALEAEVRRLREAYRRDVEEAYREGYNHRAPDTPTEWPDSDARRRLGEVLGGGE